jgi:hypothetical protein
MKKILTAALVIAMLSWGSSAMALSFTDTTTFLLGGTSPGGDYVDHGWGAVDKLDWTGDFVSWTHHFSFDPPADEVLSGVLTLTLTDDEGDRWWNIFSLEAGAGVAEDGSWDFGGVDTGEYTYDITASFLVDGEFSVTLASVWGDFYIEASDLEITYNPISDPAAPVPEPATILLMGTGLLGLVAYSRKRFNKKS